MQHASQLRMEWCWLILGENRVDKLINASSAMVSCNEFYPLGANVNTVAQDGLATTEQFSEKTVDKLIRWWSRVMNFKHSPKPSLVHFAQIEMNVELWSIFPQINNYINKIPVLITDTDHNLFEYSVVQLKRCHNICYKICSTFLSQPCFSRSRGGSSVWATCRSWDSRSGRMNRNSLSLL